MNEASEIWQIGLQVMRGIVVNDVEDIAVIRILRSPEPTKLKQHLEELAVAIGMSPDVLLGHFGRFAVAQHPLT